MVGLHSNSNTCTYRSNPNCTNEASSKVGPSSSATDQQLRTYRNKTMNIVDYEGHLEHMDRIAEQYEVEMNNLRASSQE